MLTLFRPEESTYGTKNSNEYGYSWQDLQDYLSFLVNDNTSISKFRLYAMHNITHCAKQNRKTQKLLTKFRHRVRDLWNDEERTRYASMESEERARNARNSEHSRETEELSQEPLSSATVQQYQMQIDHCNQLKDSLNTFHGGTNIESNTSLQEMNSLIMPSTTFSSTSVTDVENHIVRSNNYVNECDDHANDDNNNFEHTSSNTDVHDYDNRSNTATIARNLNTKQVEIFNIMKDFIDSPTHENMDAPYIVMLGGPGTGKSFVVKCLQQYVQGSAFAPILRRIFR